MQGAPLAERCDQRVVPALIKLALDSDDERLALQGLWSLYVLGALDASLAEQALASRHEYVRAWTIRLLGDERIVSPALLRRLVHLAGRDGSVVVRSQLACAAKRLPASLSLPIVALLLSHDEDAEDVQMPLLIWWAIEDKAISDTDQVLQIVQAGDLWHRPLMTRFIIERLARRFLSEGTNASASACAILLQHAQQRKTVDLVLSGMLQALSGQKRDHVLKPLERAVSETVRHESANPRAIELALRLNVPGATTAAIQCATSRTTASDDRLALIKALGESKSPAAVDSLLSLLTDNSSDSIKIAALSALGYFSDDHIGDAVLDTFSKLSERSRARSIELICSRPSWALKLAESIDRKTLPAETMSRELVQRLRQYDDPRLLKLIEKNWGKVRAATPFETQGRINAVLQSLSKRPGDAARGRQYFEKTCATCHKLHGWGAAVGPDLTGAERKNRELLVQNIVDPSAVIRQEFMSHVAVTKDGQLLTGLLAESTADTITLVDSKNQRTVLKRNDLEELKESPVSLMPEKLLDDLTDQQVRDLVAYLQTENDVPSQIKSPSAGAAR